jgi:phenylalanyl-tRNA synthetase beta chain
MGYRSKAVNKNTLKATIPPYRFDIMHQVDLVEDIVMAYGFENITPQYPEIATIGKPLAGSRVRSRVRDLMVGMGFQEIATYMLGNKDVLEKSLCDDGPHVEIIKPLSSEYAVMRGSLTPKLLQFLGNNVHCAFPQKVFEYGDVVKVEKGVPVTYTRLAAAISDYKVSFEDIQAVAVSLFKNLTKEIKFLAVTHPTFIEGRCAEMTVRGINIGTIGEVSPKVLIDFGIESPVGVLEIGMSSLIPLESLFLG